MGAAMPMPPSAKPPAQGRTHNTLSRNTASPRPGRATAVMDKPTHPAVVMQAVPIQTVGLVVTAVAAHTATQASARLQTGHPTANSATAGTSATKPLCTPDLAQCPRVGPTMLSACCWAIWPCGKRWPAKTTPCSALCRRPTALCLLGWSRSFTNKGLWVGPPCKAKCKA